MAEPKTQGPPDAPNVLARSMWGVFHAMLRLPFSRSGSLEKRVQLLEEERAVREVLNRYIYCYDGNDVDGLMTIYRDDCVLVNPRGTYMGRDAVRCNFEFLMSRRRFSFHNASNVAVRLSDNGRDGWLTAYLFAISQPRAGELGSIGGTYEFHVVKENGEWKVAEWRNTYNYRFPLTPAFLPPSPTAPEPTRAENAQDQIGPDFIMA